MELQLRILGTYATREGGYAKVTHIFSGDVYFKFSVAYNDGTSSVVSEKGRYLGDGIHDKDLVAELSEGAMLYLFFREPHTGVLSNRWRDYETD